MLKQVLESSMKFFFFYNLKKLYIYVIEFKVDWNFIYDFIVNQQYIK